VEGKPREALADSIRGRLPKWLRSPDFLLIDFVPPVVFKVSRENTMLDKFDAVILSLLGLLFLTAFVPSLQAYWL